MDTEKWIYAIECAIEEIEDIEKFLEKMAKKHARDKKDFGAAQSCIGQNAAILRELAREIKA